MVLNETIDGQDYDVMNVGRTVNGRIETEKPIDSPLFRVVQPPQTDPVQPTAAVPQTPPVAVTPPAAVLPPTSPAPVTPQPNEQKEQN